MEMQKRGSAIIIISVIIALIFFIAASSVGGYFVYKYYFAEEDEEDEDEKEEKGSSEKISRDAQGFVDCGRISNSLEDFDDPFFSIDFDRDKAFTCMGKNINNNCSDAKSAIDIGGVDLVYKITGSSSFSCIVMFEVSHSEEGFIWAECPMSSLISVAEEGAKDVEEFSMIVDKMEQGNGDYGASIFALMAMVLDSDLATFEQLGCARSDN